MPHARSGGRGRGRGRGRAGQACAWPGLAAPPAKWGAAHGAGQIELASCQDDPPNRSIFIGQHDREHPRRHRGIGRIGRAHAHVPIVIIHLPKAAHAILVERAEVVFAMRVVILSERVEGPNMLQEATTPIDRHGFDA
jgi:hypothetical protein